MIPRYSPRAFTLLELLVSMAVLALMTLSVLAMVNGVSQTTGADRQRMDADNEARRVLDRMGFDFAKMFKRADADSIFASLPSGGPVAGAAVNDKMFFYSEAPTYFDTLTNGNAAAPTPDPRGTAGLIGYRVPNNTTTSSYRWQLERLGKGLTWDGVQANGSAPGAVVFLTYPTPASAPPPSPSPVPTPTPFPASTLAGNSTQPGNWSQTIGTVANNYDDGVDVDYHPLSSSVFRLEYCFLLKNATAAKPFATTHDQTKGFKDVAAIVVAIALLDPPSRALIPGAANARTADLSKIAAALPDPDFSGSSSSSSLPTQLMAELWNAQIKAPGFAASVNIPQIVASRIRVYQRYFYLNTPQ